MGNVGAPATSAAMVSLPMAKAGVGSAVNDTAREVGGSLGIAVLGSLAASTYRGNIDAATTGLPESVTAIARQSVGAAVQEASRIGGDAGVALADAARSSFADAMGTTLFAAAVVLLATVAVVRRVLPDDRTVPAPVAPAPEPEPARLDPEPAFSTQ